MERQIGGEVKRKVEGIERLRLEQVPLSGDGLPVVTIRRYPQHERSSRTRATLSSPLSRLKNKSGQIEFRLGTASNEKKKKDGGRL